MTARPTAQSAPCLRSIQIDDPLLAPRVVEPLRVRSAHLPSELILRIDSEDTIAAADGSSGTSFSFLFQRSSAEERVAAYVIREHDRGRDLAEILEDPYVQNRSSPEQRARLLDRPEVIQAIGKDMIADARQAIGLT